MDLAHKSMQEFAADLYRTVVSVDETTKNTFISPASIFQALAMTLVGCRENTEKELSKSLHVPKLDRKKLHKLLGKYAKCCFSSSKGVDLSIANRLFVDEKAEVLAEYKSSLHECYSAKTRNVNFRSSPEEARETINQWVSKETKEKITDLLPEGSIDNLTYAVLTNACYFRGAWKNPFYRRATHNHHFFDLNGNKIPIPFMHDDDDYMQAYWKAGEANLIKIPFRNEDWTMLIALPQDIEGLPKLLSVLDKPGALIRMFNENFESSRVSLYLPKFKIAEKLDVKGVLQAMGVKDLFIEKIANLSGVAHGNKIHVDDIFHEAVLEIDEEGATAAAATGCKMVLCSSPPTLMIDHPFFVALMYKDSLPIFMGHVVQPTANTA